MYVMVQSAISTVYVHIYRRVNHGVIKRGVEHRLLVACSFNLEMVQFAVPIRSGCFGQLLETLSGSLGTQVLQSAFRADCRQGYLYNQFGVLSRIEVEVGRNLPAGNFGEVLLQLETTPKAVVQYLFLILISVLLDGLRQGDGKIGIIRTCPSVGDAVSREQRIVLHP